MLTQSPIRSALGEARRHPWRLFILFLSLGPFLPGLLHGFYQDDFWWLEQAVVTLRQPSRLLESWISGFFRPVGQVFFFLQFLVFRFEPILYNLVSTLTHALIGGLVWLLSARLGTGTIGRRIAVLMFLVGAGHFGKPVLWACSFPILLGTSLVVCSILVLLRSTEEDSDGHSFLAGHSTLMVIALGGLAAFTHDLFGLSPFALAGFTLLIRHPRRFRIAISLVIVGIAYFIVATSVHSEVRHSHGVGWHSALSLLQYLATLLAPVSNVANLETVLRHLGATSWSTPVAQGVIFLLGVFVLFLMTAKVWRTRSSLALGMIGIGLALIAPALVADYGRQWVDARYAYPTSAVLIPVLVSSLDGLRRIARSSSVGTTLRIGVIFWYSAILIGTVSMVHQAIQEGRDPKTSIRWERIERLLEQD